MVNQGFFRLGQFLLRQITVMNAMSSTNFMACTLSTERVLAPKRKAPIATGPTPTVSLRIEYFVIFSSCCFVFLIFTTF